MTAPDKSQQRTGERCGKCGETQSSWKHSNEERVWGIPGNHNFQPPASDETKGGDASCPTVGSAEKPMTEPHTSAVALSSAGGPTPPVSDDAPKRDERRWTMSYDGFGNASYPPRVGDETFEVVPASALEAAERESEDRRIAIDFWRRESEIGHEEVDRLTRELEHAKSELRDDAVLNEFVIKLSKENVALREVVEAAKAWASDDADSRAAAALMNAVVKWEKNNGR